MNRHILFNCACFLCSCSDCPLDGSGCDNAPEDLLLKAARKNYIRVKNTDDFKLYNDCMTKFLGEDYAKEFMKTKATVC